MKADEIRQLDLYPQHSDRWDDALNGLVYHTNMFLREIAAQFAEINERLARWEEQQK